MKHTEYIIPIGEEAKDYDEMFIAVIRKQPELIRCKNCKYFKRRSIYHHGLCDIHCNGIGEEEVTSEDQYCSWAERKEE